MADTSNVRSPIILNAGLSAAVAANGSGANIQITQIAIGDGKRVITGGETALVSEKFRSPISGAAKIAPTTWQIFADFEIGVTAFNCTEIGFYTGSTLFAYYSILPTSSDVIFSLKNLTTTIDYSIDLSIVPVGSVTVLIDETASLTNFMLGQHLSDKNPHHQYVGYITQNPTEAQRTQAQTNLGLQSSAQTQTHTSFTTTGASPSYVGVFTPSPASLVANLRAQVTFHVGNNGAAVTLNVNGLGAKPIKQYSQIGTKITPVLFAGQISDVVFDDTDWVVLDATHNRSDAGMVNWFARATPPEGYLECNGALVSRAAYQVLFWAIGTNFGAGDGSTTFQLPDLRGEFIRGWDHGRGIDTGRGFGSGQNSQNLSHFHGAFAGINGGYMLGGSSGVGNDGASNGLPPNGNGFGTKWSMVNRTDNSGYTESRPRNIALLPCIKY